MPRSVSARTLARTGTTVPTPRSRRERAALGDHAPCPLCDAPATVRDEDGRRWCPAHLAAYRRTLAGAADGSLMPKRVPLVRARVTRGVPTDARRTAGAQGGGATANAAKTHCPAGHAYTEANTGRGGRGERYCRQCKRDRERARVAEKKAADQAWRADFPHLAARGAA